VGASFRATPSQLGRLTLARALAQALASPLAGLLGHYADRVAVLCAGAALWGAMTAAFALSHSVAAGVAFWAANGVGLSFLIPSAQSLTADYNPDRRRGRAFGMLHFVGAVGALTGALFATNVGQFRVMGLEGWRFAFLTVAAASWAIGGATWLLARDPRHASDPRYRVPRGGGGAGGGWRSTLAEMRGVVCLRSFGIIVLQGIVGTTPWSALAFLTLYFELLGFSDGAASLLTGAFLAANACGEQPLDAWERAAGGDASKIERSLKPEVEAEVCVRSLRRRRAAGRRAGRRGGGALARPRSNLRLPVQRGRGRAAFAGALQAAAHARHPLGGRRLRGGAVGDGADHHVGRHRLQQPHLRRNRAAPPAQRRVRL
jgi:hypothetical protein